MQWSKVGCRPQFFDQSRCDQLVLDNIGTTVHDAMADRDGLDSQAFAHDVGNHSERLHLRFEDAASLRESFSRTGAHLKCSIAITDAIGPSREQRFFVVHAFAVNTKFKRGGPAIDYKNE